MTRDNWDQNLQLQMLAKEYLYFQGEKPLLPN